MKLSRIQFLASLFLFCAVSSQGSVWDESPIEPRKPEPQKTENNPEEEIPPNTFIDSRDNQAYRTEVIDGQLWMAENLNFKYRDSYCYNNALVNCKISGRLYTWNSAMTVCPDGWRLPATKELLRYYDLKGSLLKTGGFRAFNGDFYDHETAAYWTSDTDPDYKDYAFYLIWSPSDYVWIKKGFYKDQANSVRCVKGGKKGNFRSEGLFRRD